jgi:hypothetical protein
MDGHTWQDFTRQTSKLKFGHLRSKEKKKAPATTATLVVEDNLQPTMPNNESVAGNKPLYSPCFKASICSGRGGGPLKLANRWPSSAVSQALPNRASPHEVQAAPRPPHHNRPSTTLDDDAVPCGPPCPPCSSDPATRPGQPTPDQQTNSRNISQVKDCQMRRCNGTLYSSIGRHKPASPPICPKGVLLLVLRSSSQKSHSIGAAYVWFGDVLHPILQKKQDCFLSRSGERDDDGNEDGKTTPSQTPRGGRHTDYTRWNHSTTWYFTSY